MSRCKNRYCRIRIPHVARFCPRCGTRRRRDRGGWWMFAIPGVVLWIVINAGRVHRSPPAVLPARSISSANYNSTYSYPGYGHTPVIQRYPQHGDAEDGR